MKSSQSMNNKTVLVTGATSGIGKVTADALLGMGASVILVGRNKEKTSAILRELSEKHNTIQRIDSVLADLSSLEEIRNLADTVKSRYQVLDGLVNNAGGIFMQRLESVDGYEMTFALNHLNYFYLTALLLDQLKISPSARIVNVASKAHYGAHLDFDDLQLTRGYSAFKAYGRSKLANILFTRALATRLAGSTVTVNALHPGFVASNFGKTNNNWLYQLLMPVFMLAAVSPLEGAQTSIYLASSPEVEGQTGAYFDRKKITRPSKQALDDAAAEKLWEISAQLTGFPA